MLVLFMVLLVPGIILMYNVRISYKATINMKYEYNILCMRAILEAFAKLNSCKRSFSPNPVTNILCYCSYPRFHMQEM